MKEEIELKNLNTAIIKGTSIKQLKIYPPTYKNHNK